MADNKNGRSIGVLRWLGVVPCAFFCSWLCQSIGHGLLMAFRGPGYPEFFAPLLQYVPSGIALTVVGATVAPRRRIEVAVILALVFGGYASWKVHVLMQLTPGLANYMHATGESLGDVIGVALVVHRVARTKDQTADTPDTTSKDGQDP